MEPALVEERREQAETLIKEGYYADALCVLEGLARSRAPKSAEHVQWARAQLPKVKARLKKARGECRDACVLADQLYEEGSYAEAVGVLEKFKRGSRTAEAEELLRECKRALKKLTKLNEKIDRALYHKETHTDEFFDTVEAVLELDPKDRRAREFRQKLKEERSKENSLGWRLGLAVLGLLCLGAVIWVGKLVLSPAGEGTITIRLREPGYSVYVDGDLLPASKYNKRLEGYEPGRHRVELRRGSEVAYNYPFTIESNMDKILVVPKKEEISAVAGRPDSEPLPLSPLESEPLAELDERPNPLPETDVPSEPDSEVDEPMENVPEAEPTTINGFPIAEQTGYLRLEGKRVTPEHAVFSPDATRIAAERMTSDPIDPVKTYEIPIWDTVTGKVVTTLSTNAGQLQGMAFSADGQLLATAHANAPEPDGGKLQIWDLEDGALAQSMTLTVPPGQDEVKIKSVIFSPDGLMVGLINQDSAFVWTVKDGALKTQKSMAPADLTSIGFFPAGEILILGAAAQGNDGVMSWDMQQKIQRGFLRVPSFGTETSFPTFANSPDLSVMTVLNGNSIRRFAIQRSGQFLNGATLPKFLGEENVFQRVTYSPSGQYVMASVPGRRPLIWQDSDFNRIAILGEKSFVGAYAAAFTPDSKFVLQLDRPENSDPEKSAAVIRTWQIAE